ncbi:MAG: hypothetical protein GWP91_21280, partial [Rhodobacterales bacterium]|nr:hypothetical protein [Rhodobacterales bacterium]
WKQVDLDGISDAVLSLEPAAIGGYLRVTLDSDRTPRGPAVAPRIAQILNWASDHWDLGLDPLGAGLDLQRSTTQ